MADARRDDEHVLTCPHHGEVEGFLPMDGPLSNAVPCPILCEECEPFATTIIGYDDEEE